MTPNEALAWVRAVHEPVKVQCFCHGSYECPEAPTVCPTCDQDAPCATADILDAVTPEADSDADLEAGALARIARDNGQGRVTLEDFARELGVELDAVTPEVAREDDWFSYDEAVAMLEFHGVDADRIDADAHRIASLGAAPSPTEREAAVDRAARVIDPDAWNLSEGEFFEEYMYDGSVRESVVRAEELQRSRKFYSLVKASAAIAAYEGREVDHG